MAVARFAPDVTIDAPAAQMLAAVLGEVLRCRERRWSGPSRHDVAGVRGRLEWIACDSVPAVKDDVLDMAVALLQAAAELHRAGRHGAAMAVEGVEGRLLEALLGAGAVEPGS
ncbi:MAG: hypothetical protein ACRD0Z_13090 [Acidimicrobiales bacterium]